jgi:protein-S-isoprenylcysteine O-methyltransferase Ste14
MLYAAEYQTGSNDTMWLIMLFFLGSLVIIGFSWRVFSNPRSHGFFRFLAFEAIWAVITINVQWWFRDVLSASQIVSWIFLLGSLGLAISGFQLLRAASGHSVKESSTNYAFEQTSRLVTSGPYRYIRHPLYTSLILLAWGAALKSGSLASIFFSLLATGLLYLTALAEEEENLERFGETYAKYMTSTRMFVPGVF